MVGGVSAALADEVGVEPFVVRVAFVVLATAGGWGVVLYGALWVAMATTGVEADVTRSEPKASNETNRLVGLGMIFFGLILFFRLLGGGFVDSVVWPVALFGAGIAVAHEQGVDLSRAGRLGGDSDRSAFLVRVAGGAVLVVAGIILAVSLNFSLSTVRDSVLVAGIVIAGVGLVLGPWVVGLVNDLTEERGARIRSDERAQVAAHLHDSVLQTLTLIQRRADDSAVVTLARKQERELRNWLYGREPTAGIRSFRAGLEHELGEIEALHHVPIELVTVGDAEVDERLAAVLAATREAAVNAVVHSGSATVDVFAEVTPVGVDVFIRDTGTGFDPAAVSGDRRGLADSIIGRVERLGGSVVVDTEAGVGTEVELHLSREDQ